MNRHSTRTAFGVALLGMCMSLTAATHRAVTPPGTPAADVADALGIGPMSGASVKGAVASVSGTLITLNTAGAPAITIDATAARFMSDKSGPASIAEVKPGVRITAFINTSPTLQPSSFLRAQLITIESLADLEVTGAVDAIDQAHSRFIVLGIIIGVDSNTSFGTFPTFAPIQGLAGIAVGQMVMVTARYSSNAIVATRVQVLSPTIQPSVILAGTVKSIAPTAWVITSREGKETTVSVDSQTKIVGNPKIGDSVQVMANIDSAHNYRATAIVKLDPNEKIPSEMHGTVKSITATQWVIGGPPGSLAPDFFVTITPTTVIYPDPKVGDRVVVVGMRDSKGAFTATKIGKES